MAYKGKIPFKKITGDLILYPNYENDIEWCDNYEFVSDLAFQCFERGRSAAHAVFQDGQWKKYRMFLTDFEEVINSNNLISGCLRGVWTFTKRGANYGIKQARPYNEHVGNELKMQNI